MGRYFEEFYRYDLPRHFIDSRNRHHTFDLNGRHADACLEGDVQARLHEILAWQKIDTAGITFSVRNGIVSLSGALPAGKALAYITSSIDSLEGVMAVCLPSGSQTDASGRQGGSYSETV